MKFVEKKSLSSNEDRSKLKTANRAYTECISKDFLTKFLAGEQVNVMDFCVKEREEMMSLDTKVYGKLDIWLVKIIRLKHSFSFSLHDLPSLCIDLFDLFHAFVEFIPFSGLFFFLLDFGKKLIVLISQCFHFLLIDLWFCALSQPRHELCRPFNITIF